MEATRAHLQERTLLLMPNARDADRTVQMLKEAGLVATRCETLAELTSSSAREPRPF